MKRFFLIVFLLAALFFTLAGESSPSLLVLPFLSEDVPTHHIIVIRKFMTEEFGESGFFVPVIAGDVAMALEMSALEGDPEALAAFGEEVGVSRIVSGTVASLGDKLIIEGQIIDSTTGAVLASEKLNSGDLRYLKDGCELLAGLLLTQVYPEYDWDIPEDSPVAVVAEIAPEALIKDTPPAVENDFSDKPPEVLSEPSSVLFPPSRIAFVPFLLLQGSASLLGVMSHETFFGASDLYDEYMSYSFVSESNYAYNRYIDSMVINQGLQLGSYISSGVSALGMGISAAAAAPESLQFSLGGRIALAGGILFGGLADLSHSLGTIQGLENRNLYSAYQAADSDIPQAYDQYSTGYGLYLTGRISGYSLSLLSFASYLAASFIPGEVNAPPHLLNRLFYSVGFALMNTGSLFTQLVLNNQFEQQTQKQLMASSDDSLNPYYQGVLANLDEASTNFAIISGSLWVTGGVFVISSLFLPFSDWLPDLLPDKPGPKKPPVEAVQLNFLPLPGGFSLSGKVRI